MSRDYIFLKGKTTNVLKILDFKSLSMMFLANGVLNVMGGRLPCLGAISQDVAPEAQEGLVWVATGFCMYVSG